MNIQAILMRDNKGRFRPNQPEPDSAGAVDAYTENLNASRRANELVDSVNLKMSGVKELDGTATDFNGQDGLVVTAENVPYTAGYQETRIMEFEPITGNVRRFETENVGLTRVARRGHWFGKTLVEQTSRSTFVNGPLFAVTSESRMESKKNPKAANVQSQSLQELSNGLFEYRMESHDTLRARR